jgi:hypothetical protein
LNKRSLFGFFDRREIRVPIDPSLWDPFMQSQHRREPTRLNSSVSSCRKPPTPSPKAAHSSPMATAIDAANYARQRDVFSGVNDQIGVRTRNGNLSALRSKISSWMRLQILVRSTLNVVTLSRNLVLKDPLFLLKVVWKRAMLLVRADYVLSSLHVVCGRAGF